MGLKDSRETSSEVRRDGITGREPMGTRVVCPSCGKPSFTCIRFGAAEIHCKRCGTDFEVTIQIVRSA